MRGLPGSGKSTWIRENLNYGILCVCSADDFHMVDSVYRYDPKNIGAAHGACLRKFTEVLIYGKKVDNLVVDNTNATAIEIAPYARLCEAFGIEFEIIHLNCSFETAYIRNTHQVPPQTILAMLGNLTTEKLPWKFTVKFQR